MGDSDLLPHILDPQILAQTKNFHHQTFNYNGVYDKFNPGQLAAIKDICQSNHRVCLLQGPVNQPNFDTPFIYLAWNW